MVVAVVVEVMLDSLKVTTNTIIAQKELFLFVFICHSFLHHCFHQHLEDKGCLSDAIAGPNGGDRGHSLDVVLLHGVDDTPVYRVVDYKF